MVSVVRATGSEMLVTANGSSATKTLAEWMAIVGSRELVSSTVFRDVISGEYGWRADAFGGSEGHANLGLGVAPVSNSRAVIRSNEVDENDDNGVNATVQIQRYSRYSARTGNPKALRVVSTVYDPVAATEWAISGELINYSDQSSTGNAAVSGVSSKYGVASVFGGHFQAIDYNEYASAADVTSAIGVEINVMAVGLDNATANNNRGTRVGLDIIARTNTNVVGAADGEIGMGLRITSDLHSVSDGYFRYGVVVVEGASNPNPIGTAIYVSTTGAYGYYNASAHSTADIYLTGNSAVGVSLNGSYTTAAVRVNAGQKIAFNGTSAVALQYDSGDTELNLLNGASTERFNFGVNSTPYIKLSGTQVLSTRVTGFTTAAGSANKDASGINVGTITATDGNLQAVAAWLKSLHDAMATHGLIGT